MERHDWRRSISEAINRVRYEDLLAKLITFKLPPATTQCASNFFGKRTIFVRVDRGFYLTRYLWIPMPLTVLQPCSSFYLCSLRIHYPIYSIQSILLPVTTPFAALFPTALCFENTNIDSDCNVASGLLSFDPERISCVSNNHVDFNLAKNSLLTSSLKRHLFTNHTQFDSTDMQSTELILLLD